MSSSWSQSQQWQWNSAPWEGWRDDTRQWNSAPVAVELGTMAQDAETISDACTWSSTLEAAQTRGDTVKGRITAWESMRGSSAAASTDNVMVTQPLIDSMRDDRRLRGGQGHVMAQRPTRSPSPRRVHFHPEENVADAFAIVPFAGSAGVPAADRLQRPAADEIQDLRNHQAWTDFQAKVKVAIKGAARHALAQHTTNSNQPGALQGTCVSLKACGADQPNQQANGSHVCKILLPNLLTNGDGLVLDYTSREFQNMKQAQKEAFVEILSYILFRAPTYLKHHANQWHEGCLDTLKNQWLGVLRAGLGPGPGRLGLVWSAVQGGGPNDAPQGPLPPGPNANAVGGYVPPADDEDPAERDRRILDALCLVPRNRLNSGELPADVWPVLRREIQPGGLAAFLTRFPAMFSIQSAAPLVWRRM